MDMMVLRKRLSTFFTEKGYVKNVSNELLLDILKAWEGWTGKSREFYQGLGVRRQTMAILIKKAKRLSREGAGNEFREINPETILGPPSREVTGIEITWDTGKVIRFPNVDQLIDFLKKVA